MTFKRLFGLSFLLWLMVAAVDFMAFKYLSLDLVVVKLALAVLVIVLATAVARRLGVLNYFEAMLFAIFWLIISFFLDLLIMPTILGFNFFTRWEVWASFGLVMFSAVAFHKKRHVQIRREMAAKHSHH